MLKEAQYRCRAYPRKGFPEFHKIAYVIIGDKCYFSGLERGTSTINAAEDIIASIAKQERVRFSRLRYFDIQTRLGYRKLPGKYEINELAYEACRTGPKITAWGMAHLPEDVQSIFNEHIGVNLSEMYCEVFYESEGLIAVGNGEKFFYVNPDGTPAFAGRFNNLSGFKDGLAWVANEKGMWAQIDKEGNFKTDYMTYQKFVDTQNAQTDGNTE